MTTESYIFAKRKLKQYLVATHLHEVYALYVSFESAYRFKQDLYNKFC